jgi:hypothetical protein
MIRSATAALVVALTASWSLGASAKQLRIKALNAKIQQLKHERRRQVLAVDAHHQQARARLKQQYRALEGQLTQVGKEERAALAKAPDKASTDKTRAQYKAQRLALRAKAGDLKHLIRQERKRQDADEAAVRTKYNAMIRALEQQLQQLQGTRAGKTNPGKRNPLRGGKVKPNKPPKPNKQGPKP